MKNVSDGVFLFGAISAVISGFFVYVGHITESHTAGLVYGVATVLALLAIGLFIHSAAQEVCEKLLDKKPE